MLAVDRPKARPDGEKTQRARWSGPQRKATVEPKWVAIGEELKAKPDSSLRSLSRKRGASHRAASRFAKNALELKTVKKAKSSARKEMRRTRRLEAAASRLQLLQRSALDKEKLVFAGEATFRAIAQGRFSSRGRRVYVVARKQDVPEDSLRAPREKYGGATVSSLPLCR